MAKNAQTHLHVKTGDEVIIIAGKDKGAKGKVIGINRETERVIVEGVNVIKKHTKVQNDGSGTSGGIVTTEAPIHVSNVQLLEDGKPVRTGSKRVTVTKRRPDGSTYESERSVRISRKSGKEI